MTFDLFGYLPEQIKGDKGKECVKCNKYKPLSSFGPASGGNYLRSECKKCLNKANKVINKLKAKHPAPEEGYKCPICAKGKEELSHYGQRKTPWVMDHCHDTEEFRGYVCNKCNVLLGASLNSIENLQRAIKYLKGVKDDQRKNKKHIND